MRLPREPLFSSNWTKAPRPGKARVSGSSGHSMQGFQAKELQS